MRLEDERRASLRQGTEPDDSAPEWMVTYGDMMALLLTFTILLISFGTIDLERFEEVSGGVREVFNAGTTPPTPIELLSPHAEVGGETPTEKSARRSDEKLRAALQTFSQSESGNAASLKVFETYRGLEVLLEPDSIFVGPGATLSSRAEALFKFVATLHATEAPERDLVIEVSSTEGPLPSVYEDALSLALDRAMAVTFRLRAASKLDAGRYVPVARAAPPAPGSSPVTLILEKYVRRDDVPAAPAMGPP
ncbi:MAG: hypothetical protein EXR76_02355 [Myxococcales bacterium]|nr:hypothetical protein [Myxococcales bacterium]